MKKLPTPAPAVVLAPVITPPAAAFTFTSDFGPGRFLLTSAGKASDVEIRERTEGKGKGAYEVRSVHFLAEPDRKPFSMTELRAALDEGANLVRKAS